MAEAEETGVDFSEGDSLMVDLNDVEDVSFEAIPKGLYPVVISDLEFEYSQAKGNPMWSYRLEIEEGEFAGRVLFCHHVFKGPGLPITKRQLGRIAPELFDGPFDPKDEEVIASMLGKRVKAKVTIRKYEGENRNNVADLFPTDDSDGFA